MENLQEEAVAEDMNMDSGDENTGDADAGSEEPAERQGE